MSQSIVELVRFDIRDTDGIRKLLLERNQLFKTKPKPTNKSLRKPISHINRNQLMENSRYQNIKMLDTVDYYATRFWAERGDPRLHKSALMGGGPWQMLALTATYLLTVTWFGPQMMRRRKPIEGLMWPIRLYNLFMVLFNAYLFASLSAKLSFGFGCWGCGEKPMRRLDNEGLRLWELALLSRYFDFFDSIFFIARKKFSHLSLLHVSHHALVPSIFWFAGKLEPTPSVAFAGYINLSVHVIMYSYYFLSTFTKLRPYLWWKRYLTKIQIAQFCIHLVHGLQIVYWPYCQYHFMTYVQVVFSISYIILFGNFYIRSYLKERNQYNLIQKDQ